MTKTLISGPLAVVAILLCAHLSVAAAPDRRIDFCNGFREGYLTVKGKYAYPPACPYVGAIPYNSTPFREGIKSGIAAGSKR